MTYLYGDSTSSTLEVNYIDFLRDAVEFCVQVLMADQRTVQARARARLLDHSSTAEIDRLQQLGAAISKAVDAMPLGAPESATARCAAAIVRAGADLVRSEIGAVQSALASEAEKRDAQVARERDGSVKALEALLAKHDLPDMTVDARLTLVAGGRYTCRARLGTGFGLGAVVDLDVPAGHLYSQLVRVDRLFERLV